MRLTRLGPTGRQEWKAVLPDLTEVIVADVDGLPCPQSIAKAASVVESRCYLEERARRLLVPFTRSDGHWRLVTIDFGVEAQRHECEFLMCFALEGGPGAVIATSSYLEVGFASPMPTDGGLVFVLTVQTATGILAGA